MTEGEKQAWIDTLRSASPPSLATRRELADILERIFFPERIPGRPPMTTWQKANRALKTLHYRHLVDAEIAKGRSRPEAIKIVAKRLSLGVPGLRKRLALRK